MDFEADPINKLKPLIKKNKISRTLIITTPGLTSFYYQVAKPTNSSNFLPIFLLARTLSTAHVLPQRRSLLSTISGNVIINNVELSKNGLIMFLWEFVIYTFQDLKTQFISFKLMFWHAWLAFHQQRHPHLSWHLCGPAKSSAQQDLWTQIIDDPVFPRAK